jgi:FtsZ-interacting cell division protein ZipA
LLLGDRDKNVDVFDGLIMSATDKPQGSQALRDNPEIRHEPSNNGIHVQQPSTDSNDVEAAEARQKEESKEETPEEKKAARKYRWRIIIGILLPSILEAFDTTIIAAALSFIASEFGRYS